MPLLRIAPSQCREIVSVSACSAVSRANPQLCFFRSLMTNKLMVLHLPVCAWSQSPGAAGLCGCAHWRVCAGSCSLCTIKCLEKHGEHEVRDPPARVPLQRCQGARASWPASERWPALWTLAGGGLFRHVGGVWVTLPGSSGRAPLPGAPAAEMHSQRWQVGSPGLLSLACPV